MFSLKMSGHNPDAPDFNSWHHGMQSALHPRSETAERPLIRRRRRRHRKSMPSTGKLLAAVILVAIATVMAVSFSLLSLFLWRQGVTSPAIYLNLATVCQAPFIALRPPKDDSHDGVEFTLRA